MSSLADDPHIVAKELGLRVDLPGECELFIDIDSTDDALHFYAMVDVLKENGIVFDDVTATPSRSGNTHVRARLPYAVSDTERIALQACLGSDRKRELLSMLRIKLHAGERPPTVFFETVGA